MRDDHDTRMKEMEYWARTTQSLIEKLAERDKTIDMLRKSAPSAQEEQIKHLSEQVRRLQDENEALRLDLGLKVHGL